MGAKPGDLLRWEDLSRDIVNADFTPPAGMSISRFLYMTEDIDRKPMPANAFILLPYNKPWNEKSLNTMGPYALAQAGYAVIAPDYAGQGSDIPQGFMYEAGHSEGGMTGWRTYERLAMHGQEELLKAGKFLGAVANSPALRPLDLIPESIRRAAGGPVGDAVSVIFLQSLARLFPDQFRLEDYVTDTVLGRIPLMDQGCLLTGRALFSNLTSEQLLKDLSWLEHPVVIHWQKRYNGAGPHALAAPMLVVQGIADPLTYANNTEWDFNQTCNAYPSSKATLRLYPDADHNVAAQVPQCGFLRWIKDRFEGAKVQEGCAIETAEPVTARFRNTDAFFSGTGSG